MHLEYAVAVSDTNGHDNTQVQEYIRTGPFQCSRALHDRKPDRRQVASSELACILHLVPGLDE